MDFELSLSRIWVCEISFPAIGINPFTFKAVLKDKYKGAVCHLRLF